MKKINVKRLLVTWVILVIATAGAPVSSQSIKDIMEDIRVQKINVNRCLENVNQQQTKTSSLKSEMVKGVIIEKQNPVYQNWAQANADLKKYRAELRVGVKNLMRAHRAHLRAHQKEIREQFAVLAKAQMKVDIDFAKQNPAVLNDAETLLSARAEMRNRFTELERARLERDKDQWIVNREWMDWKGESNLQIALSSTDENLNLAVK